MRTKIFQCFIFLLIYNTYVYEHIYTGMAPNAVDDMTEGLAYENILKSRPKLPKQKPAFKINQKVKISASKLTFMKG